MKSLLIAVLLLLAAVLLYEATFGGNAGGWAGLRRAGTSAGDHVEGMSP